MGEDQEYTVLILGAGASVAEAFGHRSKQTKEHPPLDANFFERVGGRRRYVTLKQRVAAHARALGHQDLFSEGPSLEEYLGRLYFHFYHESSKENSNAYFDLVELYANELTFTTAWMASRPGMIKKVVERELQSGRKVSIATFNHDLLIENALSCLSHRRYGSAWCLQHAYPFADTKPTTLADWLPRFDRDCPGDPEDHVPIFKLHGSLNWVFTTIGQHPPPSIADRPRKISILENRVGVEGKPTIKPGKRKLYVSPLIVPPVYEKHGFIRRHLQEMWDGAAQALRQATRVVFWGYSFPNADNHARYFFQGLAQENDALRRPIVINPDPRAEDAAWAVLRPAEISHYRDVRAYLTSG